MVAKVKVMNNADLIEAEKRADGPGVHVALRTRALEISSIERFVDNPANGGICVFQGVVRRDSDLGSVESLEYDAYSAMAIAQLRHICESARAQWPEAQIAVEHRLGIVNLGEPSVVIAVGTPHRAEAFACCRFLIEKLKVEVPIWKKERAANKSKWAQGCGPA